MSWEVLLATVVPQQSIQRKLQSRLWPQLCSDEPTWRPLFQFLPALLQLGRLENLQRVECERVQCETHEYANSFIDEVTETYDRLDSTSPD